MAKRHMSLYHQVSCRLKIYTPFMSAEGTVFGSNYLNMLQQFLEPQLRNDGIIDTVVFHKLGYHFIL
jgi:hypothetical protein